MTPPNDGYGVLLADPPWKWRSRGPNGYGKSPERHYATLTIEEICALQLGQFAAERAALFLWVGWPHMHLVWPVFEAWGFTYSGLAWEWVKYNPATRRYAFGPGYTTRKNVEPCLLGLRGGCPVKRHDVRDLLFARRRQHSRKPDEQYERIEAMFDGPYLELFARTSRPGWDACGDQLGMFQ